MNRRTLLAAIAALLPLAASAHNGVDHAAHHGGILRTYKDMHYETALTGGMLQVYFSEASGEQLPASAASQMAVEIERPGARTEYADMAIDPTGVFWTAKIQPLTDPASVLHIGFMLRGASVSVDVPGAPLIAASQAAARAGAKPAAGKPHEH